MSEKNYDLVIVGTGPAGYSAAIYAARYKMNFTLIGALPGGNMSLSSEIDNYPGIPKTKGPEITQRMLEQLKGLDHEPIIDNIKSIKKENNIFILKGSSVEYRAKNILLAVGTERNKLKVPGEEELAGKGISYCATCDGFFFNNKTVVVVGGGDSAAEAAVFLSEIAKQVYIVVRRDEFRAEPIWVDELKKAPHVEIILEANVKEIIGKDKVEKVILDKGDREIDVDGVFIEIGETPASALFDDLKLERDDQKYVIVDQTMKTNVDGVWAAGDSTTGSNKFRQIVTGAAEGAIAASSIYAKVRDSK